ncbi:AMP-binding protein [SAR92 clade bacterium H231]|nr:AMP-binding protein [SAR92 clade bacterium H231]
METLPIQVNQQSQQAAELMVRGRDLPWLLAQWVERQPDKVFLIWAANPGDSFCDGADRQWTYAQFDDAVRRVAQGLQSLGVKQGQRLLIHMENSPDFLITYFACALLGVVSVLTNTRSVARELQGNVALTEVVGVVTQRSFLPLFDDIYDLSFVVASDTLLEHDLLTASRPVNPHCDLRVQFTSGTTAEPKAVLSTHANAIYAAQQTALGYGLNNSDICQVFVPLFHTNGLSTLVTSTLWVGGTVLLQRKFSASYFWPPALKYDATWTCLPGGAFFIQALRQYPVPEHQFRFWIVNCSSELAEHFGITRREHWGMTEMITLPILHDPHHPCPEGSIGRLAAGIEIAISNEQGKPCLPGEVGALLVRGIRGVTLFKEYLNNPEATANSFDKDGWFITGDRVYADAEGYLFFADREKDLLRVGGENVAASEIEAVIYQTGWVSECAVVGQQHPMLDEVPVAFVKVNKHAPGDIKNRLIDHCRKNLADFKVIRAVHIVEGFPRAALQKIAKYQLCEQLVKTQ